MEDQKKRSSEFLLNGSLNPPLDSGRSHDMDSSCSLPITAPDGAGDDHNPPKLANQKEASMEGGKVQSKEILRQDLSPQESKNYDGLGNSVLNSISPEITLTPSQSTHVAVDNVSSTRSASKMLPEYLVDGSQHKSVINSELAPKSRDAIGTQQSNQRVDDDKTDTNKHTVNDGASTTCNNSKSDSNTEVQDVEMDDVDQNNDSKSVKNYNDVQLQDISKPESISLADFHQSRFETGSIDSALFTEDLSNDSSLISLPTFTEDPIKLTDKQKAPSKARGNMMIFVPDLSGELLQGYRILTEIFGDKCKSFVWPFLDPVDTKTYWDYEGKIKHPMWLRKIESKFLNKEYQNITEFAADMRQMLENCYRYNGTKHQISKYAQRLECVFEQKLALLSRPLQEKTTLYVTSDGKYSDGCPNTTEMSSGRLRRACTRLAVRAMEQAAAAPLAFHIRQELEQQEKEEKRQKIVDRRDEISKERQDLLEWDKQLIGETEWTYMKSVWEIPAIGQFLCLCQPVLELEEISYFQLERSFAIPMESMILRRIFTTLLSTPHQRQRLGKKPPMPYKVWEAHLREWVRGWYVVFEKLGNPLKVYEKIGVPERFFEVVGPNFPLDRVQYHELAYYERVWILKALCDQLFETQLSIRRCILSQPIEEQRPITLGVDAQSNTYIHFPQFCGADLRIYRQAKYPDILKTSKRDKVKTEEPEDLPEKEGTPPPPRKQRKFPVRKKKDKPKPAVVEALRARPSRLRQRLTPTLHYGTYAESIESSTESEDVTSEFTEVDDDMDDSDIQQEVSTKSRKKENVTVTNVNCEEESTAKVLDKSDQPKDDTNNQPNEKVEGIKREDKDESSKEVSAKSNQPKYGSDTRPDEKMDSISGEGEAENSMNVLTKSDHSKQDSDIEQEVLVKSPPKEKTGGSSGDEEKIANVLARSDHHKDVFSHKGEEGSPKQDCGGDHKKQTDDSLDNCSTEERRELMRATGQVGSEETSTDFSANKSTEETEFISDNGEERRNKKDTSETEGSDDGKNNCTREEKQPVQTACKAELEGTSNELFANKSTEETKPLTNEGAEKQDENDNTGADIINKFLDDKIKEDEQKLLHDLEDVNSDETSKDSQNVQNHGDAKLEEISSSEGHLSTSKTSSLSSANSESIAEDFSGSSVNQTIADGSKDVDEKSQDISSENETGRENKECSSIVEDSVRTDEKASEEVSLSEGNDHEKCPNRNNSSNLSSTTAGEPQLTSDSPTKLETSNLDVKPSETTVTEEDLPQPSSPLKPHVEVLPVLGEFELVCDSMDSLRELVDKFGPPENKPVPPSTGRKRKAAAQAKLPIRKRCEKELHEKLTNLLLELTPWESKLAKFALRSRERFRKQHENAKSAPATDQDIKDIWASEESSESEIAEPESEPDDDEERGDYQDDDWDAKSNGMRLRKRRKRTPAFADQGETEKAESVASEASEASQKPKRPRPSGRKGPPHKNQLKTSLMKLIKHLPTDSLKETCKRLQTMIKRGEATRLLKAKIDPDSFSESNKSAVKEMLKRTFWVAAKPPGVEGDVANNIKELISMYPIFVHNLIFRNIKNNLGKMSNAAKMAKIEDGSVEKVHAQDSGSKITPPKIEDGSAEKPSGQEQGLVKVTRPKIEGSSVEKLVAQDSGSEIARPKLEDSSTKKLTAQDPDFVKDVQPKLEDLAEKLTSQNQDPVKATRPKIEDGSAQKLCAQKQGLVKVEFSSAEKHNALDPGPNATRPKVEESSAEMPATQNQSPIKSQQQASTEPDKNLESASTPSRMTTRYSISTTPKESVLKLGSASKTREEMDDNMLHGLYTVLFVTKSVLRERLATGLSEFLPDYTNLQESQVKMQPSQEKPRRNVSKKETDKDFLLKMLPKPSEYLKPQKMNSFENAYVKYVSNNDVETSARLGQALLVPVPTSKLLAIPKSLSKQKSGQEIVGAKHGETNAQPTVSLSESQSGSKPGSVPHGVYTIKVDASVWTQLQGKPGLQQQFVLQQIKEMQQKQVESGPSTTLATSPPNNPALAVTCIRSLPKSPDGTPKTTAQTPPKSPGRTAGRIAKNTDLSKVADLSSLQPIKLNKPARPKPKSHSGFGGPAANLTQKELITLLQQQQKQLELHRQQQQQKIIMKNVQEQQHPNAQLRNQPNILAAPSTSSQLQVHHTILPQPPGSVNIKHTTHSLPHVSPTQPSILNPLIQSTTRPSLSTQPTKLTTKTIVTSSVKQPKMAVNLPNPQQTLMTSSIATPPTPTSNQFLQNLTVSHVPATLSSPGGRFQLVQTNRGSQLLLQTPLSTQAPRLVNISPSSGIASGNVPVLLAGQNQIHNQTIVPISGIPSSNSGMQASKLVLNLNNPSQTPVLGTMQSSLALAAQPRPQANTNVKAFSPKAATVKDLRQQAKLTSPVKTVLQTPSTTPRMQPSTTTAIGDPKQVPRNPGKVVKIVWQSPSSTTPTFVEENKQRPSEAPAITDPKILTQVSQGVTQSPQRQKQVIYVPQGTLSSLAANLQVSTAQLLPSTSGVTSQEQLKQVILQQLASGKLKLSTQLPTPSPQISQHHSSIQVQNPGQTATTFPIAIPQQAPQIISQQSVTATVPLAGVITGPRFSNQAQTCVSQNIQVLGGVKSVQSSLVRVIGASDVIRQTQLSTQGQQTHIPSTRRQTVPINQQPPVVNSSPKLLVCRSQPTASSQVIEALNPEAKTPSAGCNLTDKGLKRPMPTLTAVPIAKLPRLSSPGQSSTTTQQQ